MPELGEIGQATVVEECQPLLLVNVGMRVLVRNAAQALVKLVEFVDLRETRMQNTEVALQGMQSTLIALDIVKQFCEAIILWRDVRFLLESIINLSQRLLFPLGRVAILIVIALRLVFNLIAIFNVVNRFGTWAQGLGCLRGCRHGALYLTLTRILEPLQIRSSVHCQATLIIGQSLQEVRVGPLK